MHKKSRAYLLPLLPCLLLILLTQINYSYWPYVWPDEALFSSPAASLVEKGIFATPVLKGLMPGMEKATLWNAPLLMVMLSGLYSLTGESLAVARLLSLSLGCISLFVFFRLSQLVFENRLPALVLTILLSLDLTFSRAANTVRMDMLTFLWFISCLFFLVRARRKRQFREEPRLDIFMAGTMTGLAGISHPIGIMLVPVVLIFTLPRLKHLFIAGLGGLMTFSTWLVYILPNFQLFLIQFKAQMDRKPNLFSLFGGKTGGIFRVYASQYQGGKPVMLGVLLLLASVVLLGAYFVYRNRKRQEAGLYFRFYLSFLAVAAMALGSSEGWYAIYLLPGILILSCMFYQNRGKEKWPHFLAAYVVLLILGSTLLFTTRFQLSGTPEKVSAISRTLERKVGICDSIYLRYRPDPYFRLRKKYPKMEILEFIPGTLKFTRQQRLDSGLPGNPLEKYNRIDCFLLDDNAGWEPELTAYLEENKDEYERERIEPGRPLEAVTLWKRKTDKPHKN